MASSKDTADVHVVDVASDEGRHSHPASVALRSSSMAGSGGGGGAALPVRVAHPGGILGRLRIMRFKLFLLASPIVLGALLIRIILDVLIDFKGIISEQSISPFSFLAMFVISTFIAGVLEDYKEAEKMPGTFSNVLDALSEKIDYVGHMSAKLPPGSPRFDAVRGQRELLEYVVCLFEFLADIRTGQEMLALTRAVGAHLAEQYAPMSFGVETDIWMVWGQVDVLRSLLTRLIVIKRTDFVSGGQMLMKGLCYLVILSAMLGTFSPGGPSATSGEPPETLYLDVSTYVNIVRQREMRAWSSCSRWPARVQAGALH